MPEFSGAQGKIRVDPGGEFPFESQRPMSVTLPLSRRAFAGSLAAGLGLLPSACRTPRSPTDTVRIDAARTLLFVTDGRSAMIRSDGAGYHEFQFDVPDQVTWQPAGVFPDGRRLLFLSMEARRDGPGRPFDEYYTQTPTHLWSYDPARRELIELTTRDRLAVFYTPQLILSNERLLVQVVKGREGSIYSMNLDGSDARPFTRANEGLPYGMDLSPDGRRVAFHLASPEGYQIWTCDLSGGDRRRLAGQGGHLYFGPVWSRDGEWIAYLDCEDGADPGHDWADVWICRGDGREARRLTQGQSLWFAATYGGPARRGGGSNMVAWTPGGELLVARRDPGTRVPWEYQAGRPDTDHFNREYKPESARGGVRLARLDPRTGAMRDLTPGGEGVWECRASASADGREMAFCRAMTGGMLELWVMNTDGAMARRLSAGREGKGADHPRWMVRS